VARIVNAARGLSAGEKWEAPAWLASLDLACASAAALLWALAPTLGPYPLVLASVVPAIRLLVSGRLSRRTPFDLPLGLFLLTAILGVWSAYDAEAAWLKLWLITAALLLYYALANATALGDRRAWLPAVLGAGVAVYHVMTNDWSLHQGESAALARLGEALQGLAPPIAGPRLNPNEAGGMLAMLLPFAAWLTWDAWRQRGSVPRSVARPSLLAAGFLLLVISSGLVVTFSRGAWLALAIALYAGGAWLVAGRVARGGRGRRIWVWAGLLAVAALLAMFVLVVLASIGLLSAAMFSTDTLNARLEFHRYGLLLAKDYAFVGAGLDNFLMLYASYALLTHVGYIYNIHNLYIGVAIAQGLPGLLALAWMGSILALAGWRAARGATGAGSPSSSLAGIGYLSVGILILHGFSESALYGKGVFLLFLPLAFALPAAQAQAEPAVARRKGALSLAFGIALALALIVGLLGPRALLAQVRANLGAVYQSQAELGSYSWPEWPLQDAVRGSVDLQRAMTEYEQALSLDADNGTANRRLGTIELSLGRYEDALHHLQAAYAAEPWSVTARQLLGEALVVNGYVDEGRALWAEVNNGQRQLDLRAFWYGYIGDGEREAAIRKAAAGY
jgi:tetratricopeptide (TPR) repeat protein